MNTITKKLPLVLLAASVVSSPLAFAEETSVASGIKKALSESKVNVSLRLRYEGVDEDGANGAADKDADALTLKSRITVKTGAFNNISMGVEVDNTTALVDDYNDLKLDYSGTDAVVADPEITDVNQAYLQYKNDKLTATAGRQRILHNNQRFVGGVGWRQNEQTYDGLRLQYMANDAFSIDYSYVHNANRIFADDKKGDDLGGDFHFLSAPYKVNKNHKITGFAYLLDFEDAVALSSNTYGALYNGKFGNVFVNASAATQSDTGDNKTSYDATYYNLEAGTKLGQVTVLGGYEVLGSDDGKAAFSTPFATLHKFQGFADKFLSTPADGIEDMYITAKTKVSGIKLAATYHDLSSNEGSTDYGTEVDLVAAYTFNKSYNFLVKYASYSADDLSTDTSKIWVQLSTKF